MTRTQIILKGAAILTLTGLTTRIMGFFYRIFLSRTLGEAGVGIYQLIFPVYALGFSLTSAGIEIAISRLVAKYNATGNKGKTKSTLYSGIILTLFLSVIFTLLLQKYSDVISAKYLYNESTRELLLILSYIFPLTALHSCIVGYYLGLKQTRIPSVSQIIEQSMRIFSVLLFYHLGEKYHFSFSISFAVLGLIIGEFSSALYCFKKITYKNTLFVFPRLKLTDFIQDTKELLSLSLPITTSRVMLNILQSVEAVSIPLSLQTYGLSSSESLSMYGVLTGMALPCILFPSAITNAISTMLLPTVSEIQAVSEQRMLTQIVKKAVISCTFLGVLFCIAFLSFGNYAGQLLFNSTLAGKFLITLAWMCPFLYTNNTLLSIINGVGRTWISFLINSISLTVRLISVISFIPLYGIYGYLCGLLLSQIIVFALCLLFLFKQFKAEAN